MLRRPTPELASGG